MVDYITFWRLTDPYPEFSQWYPSEFRGDSGVKYCSAEQYMMAHKALLFNDKESYKLIMAVKSPQRIKQLGRKIKNFSEEAWNEHRYQIVLRGTYLKFSQNEKLREVLLNTKNQVLVEASPVDLVWGAGIDARHVVSEGHWPGLNLLGQALMEVREKLKK